MNIKIENSSAEGRMPSRTHDVIQGILKTVPREQLRGLDRIRIVDAINDPRVRVPLKTPLPGLYHPKQGSQAAWLEVALDALLPPSKPFYKRVLPRLSFKANLAAIIFSLIGQHYFMTLRHSVKRGQLEASVRTYTEKHLKKWNESQHSFRARLFRPFQPTLERWARSLQQRAKKARGNS